MFIKKRYPSLEYLEVWVLRVLSVQVSASPAASSARDQQKRGQAKADRNKLSTC